VCAARVAHVCACRTLAAADNALLLIDGAKGIEPQTRKLFAVARLRGLPVFSEYPCFGLGGGGGGGGRGTCASCLLSHACGGCLYSVSIRGLMEVEVGGGGKGGEGEGEHVQAVSCRMPAGLACVQ
jgi:hypothetical protein